MLTGESGEPIRFLALPSMQAMLTLPSPSAPCPTPSASCPTPSRYSSIQLLGDLLYCVSGLSGKMSTVSEEDENFGTEEARKLLITKLGLERRNNVLAGLYMGRSDVALMVRQISLHVWKVVVTNTPRTLREILPHLLALVLGSLTSELHDHRQVAARTLGDMVRKLGQRVLPEVVPLLEERLQSESQQERQGVCIGLSEIIKCSDIESVSLPLVALGVGMLSQHSMFICIVVHSGSHVGAPPLPPFAGTRVCPHPPGPGVPEPR